MLAALTTDETAAARSAELTQRDCAVGEHCVAEAVGDGVGSDVVVVVVCVIDADDAWALLWWWWWWWLGGGEAVWLCSVHSSDNCKLSRIEGTSDGGTGTGNWTSSGVGGGGDGWLSVAGDESPPVVGGVASLLAKLSVELAASGRMLPWAPIAL